jgi:large conductance mechanosensitive channel
MPIVGLMTGGVDFTKKFISLDGNSYESIEAAKEAGAAIMTYGNLVQATINFIIIAFFVFVVLRAAEKAKKKEEAAVPAPAGPTQEELLIQIRDLLKK